MFFLFLCLGESTRRQPQANSHNRLFGEAARPVATPSKNHFRSNLPFGSDAVDSKANGNGKIANGNGHAANGNGHAVANGNGIAHTNGNGNGIEHGDISNGKVLNGHTNGHKSGEKYSHFNSLQCIGRVDLLEIHFGNRFHTGIYITRNIFTQFNHLSQTKIIIITLSDITQIIRIYVSIM